MTATVDMGQRDEQTLGTENARHDSGRSLPMTGTQRRILEATLLITAFLWQLARTQLVTGDFLSRSIFFPIFLFHNQMFLQMNAPHYASRQRISANVNSFLLTCKILRLKKTEVRSYRGFWTKGNITAKKLLPTPAIYK